jgi:hypothetical protein
VVNHRQLLHEQWDALRVWIEESGLLDHRTEPSVLQAWNVHELVTHVGRSFLALTVLGPETRTAPLALGEYVAGYGASAQEIADGTKQLARSFESDLLGGIDHCARLGFRTLDQLHSEVVSTPRGALRLDDFVATRVIELVVHGDDLARSVPAIAPPPLLEGAVALVVDMLTNAYTDRVGRTPQVDDHMTWVRLATGRAPSDDPALPLL